jgi:hypothetical protein
MGHINSTALNCKGKNIDHQKGQNYNGSDSQPYVSNHRKTPQTLGLVSTPRFDEEG